MQDERFIFLFHGPEEASQNGVSLEGGSQSSIDVEKLT